MLTFRFEYLQPNQIRSKTCDHIRNTVSWRSGSTDCTVIFAFDSTLPFLCHVEMRCSAYLQTEKVHRTRLQPLPYKYNPIGFLTHVVIISALFTIKSYLFHSSAHSLACCVCNSIWLRFMHMHKQNKSIYPKHRTYLIFSTLCRCGWNFSTKIKIQLGIECICVYCLLSDKLSLYIQSNVSHDKQ